jgi:hypothetical protein
LPTQADGSSEMTADSAIDSGGGRE